MNKVSWSYMPKYTGPVPIYVMYRVRAWHVCVTLIKWTKLWWSTKPRSGPGALVWKHPQWLCQAHISTHWNLHKRHYLNKSYIKMWKNLHQLVHRAWKLFWSKMATLKQVKENLRLNCLLTEENLAEASKNLARREHPVNTNNISSKKTTSDSFCINKSKYWFLHITPQCSAFCLQTLAVVRHFHFRGGGSLFTSAGFPARMLLFGSSLIERKRTNCWTANCSGVSERMTR